MRLRVGVVAFDGATLGDTVGSCGELVLRAQMFIVAVQLSQLRDAIERATNNGGHHTHPRPLALQAPIGRLSDRVHQD